MDGEAGFIALAPSATDTRWIGRAVPRVEDFRLLTGGGRYVDDHQPPGCLHLEFLRSPYPRGWKLEIDLAGAREMPDVVAVFTREDLGVLGHAAVNSLLPGIKPPPFDVLAGETVEAVGQPVAAVVAKSAIAAKDAIDVMRLTVEPLPLRCGEAVDTAIKHHWAWGPAEAAFAEAAHVVEIAIEYPILAPTAMEPRAALAIWDEAETMLTVWLSTQTPHRCRTDLSVILALAAENIRVIAPDVGGAFGGKASIFPEDAMVAWAARALRCPVKWCATRSEDFQAATLGRGARIEGALALSAEGKALGLRSRLVFPLGHWMPYSAAAPANNAGRILPGPYGINAIEVDLVGQLTSTASVNIYRGAGRPEACMLMERLMDRAAAEMAIDPLELRRRNLIEAAALPLKRPNGEELDSGDYPALLAKAAEASGYAQLCRERAWRRDQGEIVGVGIAIFIEPCGMGWESATVGLAEDGIIIAATGSSAQGQGRETAYAQIVGDILKLPLNSILVRHGDTKKTPAGIGALASRSTAIGGSALMLATKAFLGKAAGIAGRVLNCAPEELSPAANGLELRGERIACLSWAAIAQQAFAHNLEVTGDMALTTFEKYTAPREAWSAGCCIASVAIDAETGEPRIEQLTCVDDAGVVVNPTLVDGQLIGGLAQGLGEALLERIVYDEAGQLLTGSLMDYALPRATDMPPATIEKLGTPSTANVLGAKGVGEAGCIGVPAAIVNAVVDALSPFGVTHLDMPLTAEKIWRTLPFSNRSKGATTP